MDQEILSRKIKIEHKLFFFDLKANPNGKYLKITESGKKRSFIIIPESGWKDFRDILNEIIEIPAEEGDTREDIEEEVEI
ncbi:MAG: PUR family DNA/RNA-binding protein [Candidatus Eremiobacterota bacterium]